MLASTYNGLEFEREIDQTMRQILQVEERPDRIRKISEWPFESTIPRAYATLVAEVEAARLELAKENPENHPAIAAYIERSIHELEEWIGRS
jgi:hypothetical protein